MSHNLTVIKAFGAYRVGQTVDDQNEVVKILANPKQAKNVNRTLAPVALPQMVLVTEANHDASETPVATETTAAPEG